jgi:hypothetical protein
MLSYAEPAEKIYQGFTYKIVGGKAYILDYAGNNRIDNDETVIVPGKIEKKPVVEVELYDVGGKYISFRQCTQLKSIYGLMIFFDRIDLAKTAKLQSLELHESGGVSSLSLSACKQLKELYLDVNSLEKLTLNACTKLQNCFITHTKLKTLNVNRCAALRELKVYDSNGLTKVSLSKCRSLNKLVINNTGISGLSLGEMRSLKNMDVSDNQLKKLRVSTCPALNFLTFSFNKGLSVDISKNRNLKSLSYTPLAYNGIQLTILNPRKIYPKVSHYTNM